MSLPATNTSPKLGLKRRLVILSFGLLAVVGLVVWRAGGSKREPLHKGKPISYWVDQACRAYQNEAFVQEVEEIGAPAVPYLVEKLRLRDTWLRRTWGSVRKVLPPALRNKLPPVESVDWAHHCALVCLGQLGPKAESAVPELIRLLAQSSRDFDTVCQTLGDIGRKATPAVPALRSQLPNITIFDQVFVATAVWRISGDTNLPCEILAKALTQEQDDGAAMNAAAAAMSMGKQAVPLVSALLHLATNTAHSANARLNAARAAGTLGLTNQAVIATLLEGTKHSDLYVRADCALDLWHINPKYAPFAVPIVVEMLADKKKRLPGDRTELTDYKFMKLDFTAAIPALKELLKSDSPQVRLVATEALKKIEGEAQTKSAQ